MTTEQKPTSFAREDFKFFTRVPTRWGDSDMMGHINNVLFVRYLESGRLAYINDLLNVDMNAMSDEGIIIAEISVSYLNQVRHPAELDVATRIGSLGNSAMDFESAIYLPNESHPLVTSKATLVWFSYHENASKPLPEEMRELIKNFEGI